MACSGTSYEPYEETNGGIPVRIAGLNRNVSQWQEMISANGIRPDRIKDLKKSIESAQEFIQKLQKRFDDWKPA